MSYLDISLSSKKCFKPSKYGSDPLFGPIWARVALNLVSFGSYFRDVQFDYKFVEIRVHMIQNLSL
ncbi:hypothetical protein KFK09_019773 [Dendrobium nobile]|uniref:Uncharacterized protein n=1 Tax=Dendrobium nobile TaxID=94219 RepID=A0A8T3AXL0_DENNO|nr:hypothetical protein KFK09_019773 [Dendrobium nobile]